MAFSFDSLQQILEVAWFALIAGLLIQMAATQWLKMYLPVKWSDRRRASATNLMAFVSGAIPTASILYELDIDLHIMTHTLALWLAVLIGFTGPLIYKIVVALVYKYRPDIAVIMSGHNKAIKKRNGMMRKHNK